MIWIVNLLHSICSFLHGHVLFLETKTFNGYHDLHQDGGAFEFHWAGVQVEPFDLIVFYEGTDVIDENLCKRSKNINRHEM